METSLQNKVVIVTGASSGVGAAMVKELLGAGARVVAVARRIERLHELGQQLGADADCYLPVQCDIQNEQEAGRLVQQALRWGGALDVLINNAGLSRGALLENCTADDLRQMIDTNLFALVNLTRLATPHLKSAKGSLVNVSSTVVDSLIPGSAVYAATKAAVAAFSEVMRKEFCSAGVRVVDIYPGMIDTEFFDHADETKKKGFAQMKASIEPLQAKDLADVVLFALTRPAHVALNEIVIRPTLQSI